MGKETDAALRTVDRETDAAADAIDLRTEVKIDRLRLRKTDYVVARGIGGAVRHGRSPDNVSKDLNNAHGLLVAKRCPTTEDGASTVDAECGDDR